MKHYIAIIEENGRDRITNQVLVALPDSSSLSIEQLLKLHIQHWYDSPSQTNPAGTASFPEIGQIVWLMKYELITPEEFEDMSKNTEVLESNPRIPNHNWHKPKH